MLLCFCVFVIMVVRVCVRACVCVRVKLILQANSECPDQMPRSVAPELGLHCVTMSH